jgi:hypothetical protein
MTMHEQEPVDETATYLIEEAEALDAIRENLASAAHGIAWAHDAQAEARSLLAQLTLPRHVDVVPFRHA